MQIESNFQKLKTLPLSDKKIHKIRYILHYFLNDLRTNDFVGIKIVAEQSFSCTCIPDFHLLILNEVEFELIFFYVPVFVKTPF